MFHDDSTTQDDGAVTLGELFELVRRHARLLAVGAVVGLTAGLALLSVKDPAYRVNATLLLDTNQSQGVLGELAALTSAPQAVSEMEILRARTTAAAVVDGWSAGEEQRGWALTTLVEHDRYRPLTHLAHEFIEDDWDLLAKKPRLRAVFEPDPLRIRQPELIVEFRESGVVRISKARLLEKAGFGGEDLFELDYVPGERISYDGLGLWLYPEGDLTGESFRIRSLSREDAIERVMEGTRINETERNSGVIEIAYDDSDPYRAAETANALCGVYLDRNQARSEKRASYTVDFIKKQLEEQIAALEQAELEVVELQQENPKSVDISATGQALIGELTSLEVEKIQTRMLTASLREALVLLEAGEFEALSRMGPELPDPIAKSYVAQIARLSTERELLGRTDSGAFKSLVQAKTLELGAEADAIGVKTASLAYMVSELEAGNSSILGGLVTTEEAGEQDPLLRSYISRWTSIDNRLRELEIEFTDELPEIQSLHEQLEDLEGRILAMLEGRLAGFEAQRAEYERLVEQYSGEVDEYPGSESTKINSALESLQARTLAHLTARMAGLESHLNSLSGEAQTIEESLAQLPEDERVLADPMRRLEAHSEIVKFLLSRQQEAEISRAGSLATAEFIDVAVPPRSPRGPLVPLYLALGAVAGLGLALGWAVVRESIDRGIFTSAELELSSGLPVFGSIPDYKRGPCRIRGAGSDFVALRDEPESAVAEAYRSLRSNLKFVLNTGQPELEQKAIAFTSCTQGEGKSVTNVDMALAFALAGKRVLLVDADMRRPAVSRYLRVSLSPGLSDVLRGELDWRECVQAEVFPGLDVLPAGPQPASPGDLFAGKQTRRFIEETREAYDLVVFDVPPALAVADIDCLAPLLDALLLVTRSAKLSQAVVQEGVRRLRRTGANVVGAVLNAARPSRGEQKYGYGYGYGYGSAAVAPTEETISTQTDTRDSEDKEAA